MLLAAEMARNFSTSSEAARSLQDKVARKVESLRPLQLQDQSLPPLFDKQLVELLAVVLALAEELLLQVEHLEQKSRSFKIRCRS